MKGLVGQLLLEAVLGRYVAEAPDSTDDVAIDALGMREAIEDAPVLEEEDIVAVGLRLGVEIADLGQERIGVDQLSDHEPESLVIVAAGEDRRRYAPQVDEALVVAAYAAGVVYHEDPVGSGIQSGVQKREGAAEHLFARGQLGQEGLVQAPGGHSGCAHGHHEDAVDSGPGPGMGNGGLVVVDGGRVKHARKAVL